MWLGLRCAASHMPGVEAEEYKEVFAAEWIGTDVPVAFDPAMTTLLSYTSR